MLDVSETVALQMAGRRPKVSVLVYADFLSGPQRMWPGIYPLTSGGHTWQGVDAQLVQIDPGTPSVDGGATPFSIGLSGVSQTAVARVKAGESEAIGRTLQIFLQFFDEDWQPLDGPISLRRGRMTGFAFSGAGPVNRSILVRAEGALVARGRPPLTYLSDAEQQARFPGDRGLEFVASLQSATVVFPK